MKEVINKKVYRLIEKNGCGYVADKSTTYIITEVKSHESCKDYCEHYVLKSESGETIEIRQYECIFIPDETLSEIDMISRYLNDNGCYHDNVYHENEQLCVYISWGDWKHSFIWLNNLMKYIGYDFDDEEVTEENGSDCYSAIHYFKKSA